MYIVDDLGFYIRNYVNNQSFLGKYMSAIQGYLNLDTVTCCWNFLLTWEKSRFVNLIKCFCNICLILCSTSFY